MARLVFWFDVETTGIDPDKCDVIELAFLIEANGITREGQIIDQGHILIAPRQEAQVQQGALDTIGKTLLEIQDYPSAIEAHTNLCLLMDKYCNRYNRNDKFVLAGYNVNFDDSHLRAFFKKCKDKFYGSWFMSCKLDVMSIVAEWQATAAPMLPNFKLGTLCQHFGIELDAHQALSDVTATRQLYYRLKEEMKKCN